MSFLKALQQKKGSLRSTDTIVKTPGGDVLLEQRDEIGRVTIQKVATSAGYIVDLKPDLQVAMVLPGLCLGSQDVTQDENVLREHKISHVLSIGVQVNRLPGREYAFYDVLDIPEFNMKTIFRETSELIARIRRTGGVAFVHCNAGVSRSPAIVIAYLMKHQGFHYQQAFDQLRHVRPCVKPNEGFVQQLKLLEKTLFDK